MLLFIVVGFFEDSQILQENNFNKAIVLRNNNEHIIYGRRKMITFWYQGVKWLGNKSLFKFYTWQGGLRKS